MELPDILELITRPEELIQGYPLKDVYRGIVVDDDDPEKRGRVRVRIERVWQSSGPNRIQDEDIPWADVPTVGQGTYKGAFWIPEKDDPVIVRFEGGNAEYPIVVGGWYGFVSGTEPDVPKAARGEDDTASALKGSDTATGAAGATITEPANPAAAEYPKNRVMRFSSGHLLEFDDTPGAERINIAHKSGSWAEFHPDGKLVFGVQNNRYVVVTGDDAEHIRGRQDVIIDGASTKKSVGAMDYETNNNYTVKSMLNMTHQAMISILMKANVNIVLQATANVSVQATAAFTVTAPVTTITSSTVTLSLGGTPNGVVTGFPSGTHPFDYITGIPIAGLPGFLAG